MHELKGLSSSYIKERGRKGKGGGGKKGVEGKGGFVS